MIDPATAELRRRQFALLLGRHRYQDVILVRVLTEHYQHVATGAKAGRVDVARAQLRALAEGVPLPESPELRLVVEFAALPVSALIQFQQGDLLAARQLLTDALDVGAELAFRYGHDYVTGKRLHLAANLARIAIAEGHHEQAAALLADLHAVSGGQRSRWPFAGVATLEVPLPDDMRAVIDAQLRREQARLVGAVR